MKERRVTIRGLVPLVLCASAAARMHQAGKAAFSNHSRFGWGSRSRGSTLRASENTAAGRRVRSRITVAYGRRYRDSPVALKFSSSSAADADDDLDAIVKAAVQALPRKPRVAVVGAGFAGLATAYHLAAFGSDVTVFDPNEAGAASASSVAAGLLHPLTPRGKLIWKGEEGFKAAKHLIETVNAKLAADDDGASGGDAGCDGQGLGLRGCLTTDKVYRPLMDDKQLELFTTAARDLPQWVQSLTREELMEAVPGSNANCRGGVLIRGALAVDAPAYLRGLWASIRGLVNASARVGDGGSSGGDGSGSGNGSATWVRQKVVDVHALADSGEFSAVVACVGAGVKVLAGVKDIVSLRFVRGQSLLYENTRTPPGGGAGGTGRVADAAGAASKEGAAAAAAAGAGSDDGSGGRLLQSAVLAGQYVVPAGVDKAGAAGGNGGKIILGSTQEHVMSGQPVDNPPDVAKALRQLRPKVAEFFPALEDVEPIGVTSGVRVIQDRNSVGRIPIAGRLPFSERGWVIAALGARGLIHHAYLGRLVAACALLDSDERLPPQVMAPLEDLGKEATGDL